MVFNSPYYLYEELASLKANSSWVDGNWKFQRKVDMETNEGIELEVDQEKGAEVAAASAPIPAAKPKFLKIAAAPAERKRKGVVIRDPEEELHVDTPAETPTSREEMEKEDEEIIKSINETPAQKAAKRRKLSEEAQEANNLKGRLEIVPDEDDDVFVKAIPLAQKVPVVDYQVVVIDNKSRYKIIRADETHQLHISFTTLLKNFDREDLEAL
nr:hypothetical protein [Tanacetum cinerariifolium]